MTAPPRPVPALAVPLARHRAGDLAGAEQGYRAILAADPGQPDALHLLGVLAHQCGHHAEAARLIGEALARRAGVAEYHANLGLALHALGRDAEAEAAYRRALALREAYPEAHNSLGSAIQERGDPDGAAVHYRRALALRADYAEAWTNLGTARRAADRHAGAERALRRALALAPDDPVAWTNLGVVRKEAGHKAETAHGRALRLAPGDPEALVNLGLLRAAQGRRDAAEALYRQALDSDRDGAGAFALARWNLALLLLGRGGLAEGQALYEARFASRRVQGGRDDLTLPRWDGGEPAGRRLLVWREQGLGDELMFGSVLPTLAARAGGLVVEADARLTGLLARSLPGATVRRPTHAPADADAHVALGSLPGRLRPRLADFPAEPGWLRPDPARVEEWRGRLAALGPGLRVGICWRSQHQAGDRRHAYTALADWAPLFALPGLTLVSLQYDDAEAEILRAEARFGVRLHRWADADLRNDLETAAALTANLDLVVTVATSVGEMAGALGVPVWRFGNAGDWTALGTAVRPWFPSLRLWSAGPGETLPDLLGRIAGELRRLATPRAKPDRSGPLAEARRLHEAGRWPEAERAYQRLLDRDAENPEALDGYGWLGQQAGRPDIAVTLLTRAIAAQPSAGRHKRRALAHQTLGDLDAAEADWRAAIGLAPGDVEALGSLGVLRLARGDPEGSARATGEALRHAPDHAGLRANRGLALQAAGRDGAGELRRALALDPALAEAWNGLATGAPAPAERAAGRALALRPGYPEALGNRGVALLGLGQAGAAVASLRAALRLRPEDGGTLGNLALALERAGDGDAAGLMWWRAILLAPGDGAGWAGLADLRQRQGRMGAAVKAWGRALAAAPERADWRYNSGNALHAAGRPADADAAYRLAVESDPSMTLAAFNRGYAALARGELAAGWAGLEARFASGQAAPDRRFRVPTWDGSDAAGKTVLVWREQGLGDEVMHSACYADLIARAGRVIVEWEPRLVGLFARSFPTALVRAATADPADADVHVAAGSLPLRLRGGLTAFPARVGWLKADERAVEGWRRHLRVLPPLPPGERDGVRGMHGDTRGGGPALAGKPHAIPKPDAVLPPHPNPLPGGEREQDAGGRNTPLLVGLCWRSRLMTGNRAANHTRLDRWGPVLTLPGLRLVSLQYDDDEAERAAAEARFGIRIHRPGIDLTNDLDGAAALTASLDLVISTGTSVAEMAGALGVPVWRIGWPGEWTALGTACRPWFPSMRLFAPPPGGTADDALDAVGRALTALTRPERPRP